VIRRRSGESRLNYGTKAQMISELKANGVKASPSAPNLENMVEHARQKRGYESCYWRPFPVAKKKNADLDYCGICGCQIRIGERYHDAVHGQHAHESCVKFWWEEAGDWSRLSFPQPIAGLVAAGIKKSVWRGVASKFRGRLLISSNLKLSSEDRKTSQRWNLEQLRLGEVVGIVDMVSCIRTPKAKNWKWSFENARILSRVRTPVCSVGMSEVSQDEKLAVLSEISGVSLGEVDDV